MKINLIFSLSILSALILNSCSTSNEVVGGGIFQKRKYNNGFYWNKSSNLKEGTSNNIIKIDENKSPNETTFIESNSSFLESKEVLKNVALSENTGNENTLVKNESSKNKLFQGNNSKKMINTWDQENLKNNCSNKIAQGFSMNKSLNKPLPSSNGNTGSIIMLILLIVLIILIFSLLNTLLGGTLSWILGIVVLVLIIYFLLKLLGIID